jgi:hypothetical protein
MSVARACVENLCQHECQAGHDNSPLLFVRCKIQFCNFSSRISLGVYLISVYLMGVYLIGVHLMGVSLMGVHLTRRAPHRCIPHRRAPH